MTALHQPLPTPAASPWRIVTIGVVSLAVAMGIGRFAFTPLLPLMLRDGTLTAATGAEWAAANYAGYLVGALTASRVTRDAGRGLRWALVGVALTTLAIALVSGPAAALAGALLRGAAGVFSAWTLVFASSWGLAALARLQAAAHGAWIYTGVGSGIAVAGLISWLGGQQSAALLWLELGLLSVAGALVAWIGIGSAAVDPTTGARGRHVADGGQPLATTVRPDVGQPLATHERSDAATAAPAPRRNLALVLCYGTFGFGYIVPATFLPAMAREQVADPLIFGLIWPLFGLAAALSVGAAARWLSGWPRRRVWALAQCIMAAGTALPLLTTALWSLAAAAILVGGTFMVATMAGLQLAREHTPDDPTPLLARMTVAFAAGQIAGPVLVRAIGATSWAGLGALDWANALATALLAITGLWLWRGSPGPGRR